MPLSTQAQIHHPPPLFFGKTSSLTGIHTCRKYHSPSIGKKEHVKAEKAQASFPTAGRREEGEKNHQ